MEFHPQMEEVEFIQAVDAGFLFNTDAEYEEVLKRTMNAKFGANSQDALDLELDPIPEIESAPNARRRAWPARHLRPSSTAPGSTGGASARQGNARTADPNARMRDGRAPAV